MNVASSNSIRYLEEKILQSIPILEAMGIQLQSVTQDQAILSVPLKPNHNHKNTAFGGSLYAACTAASYALIYSLQIQDQLTHRDLVITRGEIQYLKPVSSDFLVTASIAPQEWEQMTLSLRQRKPQRIKIECEVTHKLGSLRLCFFKGEFALLPA